MIYLLGSLDFGIFNFPFFYGSRLWMMISYTCILFITLLFFFIAWLKDPGYLVRKRERNLLYLVRNNDTQNICPDCYIVKPTRSRHCEIC